MNVLSLFDGISCGHLALDRADIPITKYYASEIDKYAIKITQENFPDTIQLGDITQWREWEIDSPDIIIGGCPCQGFSFAGKQLNFDDPRSKLFFEFAAIVKHYKPKYFLLENVKMKKESEAIITETLGVEPVEINSALVSAQERVRLYWFNIKNVTQPDDKKIFIDSIVEDIKHTFLPLNRLDYLNYDKSKVDKGIFENTPTQIGNSRRFGNAVRSTGKAYTLRKVNPNGVIDKDYKIRHFTPIEAERLQTLPDNYTLVEGIKNKDRYEAIGNGWTVDVIAHILRNIK